MTETADHFSQSYAEARAKFRAAATKAGAETRQNLHPLKGPDGQEIATDVARFGPATARRILGIGSSTHGVEGYCGFGFHPCDQPLGLCLGTAGERRQC